MNFIPNEMQCLFLASMESFMKSDKTEFALLGYAGTGKTTTMKELARRLGCTIYFVAPTNAARVRLEDSIGKGRYRIWTLHKFLYAVDPDNGRIHYRRGDLPEEQLLHRGDLVVVDEASMACTKDVTELRETIKSCNAKVLYVGDPFQLPAVEEGKGPFIRILEDMQKRGDYVLLDKVMRQAEGSPILAWATALRGVRKVFFPACTNSEVKVGKNVIGDYVRNLAAGGNAQMVCWTNKARCAANRAIRKLLGKGEAPEPGDKVVGIANSEPIDVFNSVGWELGDIEVVAKVRTHKTYMGKNEGAALEAYLIRESGYRWLLLFTDFMGSSLQGNFLNAYEIVENLDTATAQVITGHNRKGDLILEREVGIITYGYAVTCHKSQGSQWEKVALTEVQQPMAGKGNQKDITSLDCVRWLYTAITRAEKKLFVADYLCKHGVNWSYINEVANLVGTQGEGVAVPPLPVTFGKQNSTAEPMVIKRRQTAKDTYNSVPPPSDEDEPLEMAAGDDDLF